MSKILKVWSKFAAVTKKGAVINLRVVDTPKILYEEVLDLYVNYFAKEELTLKAAGVSKSSEALEELRETLLKATNKEGFHVVTCHLDTGDGQINDVIGASMMSLTLKGDPEPEFNFKTEEMKKLFEILYDQADYYDEVKAFDLDRCYSDRGLFVCPAFRGLGIAQEFLKVRRMICKEHGIPINGAWMTSYGTQKAAERDGWETVCEIQSEELEKKHDVTFEKNPPSSKFMIARIT